MSDFLRWMFAKAGGRPTPSEFCHDAIVAILAKQDIMRPSVDFEAGEIIDSQRGFYNRVYFGKGYRAQEVVYYNAAMDMSGPFVFAGEIVKNVDKNIISRLRREWEKDIKNNNTIYSSFYDYARGNLEKVKSFDPRAF